MRLQPVYLQEQIRLHLKCGCSPSSVYRQCESIASTRHGCDCGVTKQLAQCDDLHLKIVFFHNKSLGHTRSMSSFLFTVRSRLSTSATRTSKARPPSLTAASMHSSWRCVGQQPIGSKYIDGGGCHYVVAKCHVDILEASAVLCAQDHRERLSTFKPVFKAGSRTGSTSQADDASVVSEYFSTSTLTQRRCL